MKEKREKTIRLNNRQHWLMI